SKTSVRMMTPHTARMPARAEIAPTGAHTASLRLRRCDSRNWTVDRRQTKKDGTPGKYIVQGYYPTLEQAANRIPGLDMLAEAVRAAKADLSAQANAGAEPTPSTGGGEIVVSPATERPQTLRYRIAWERSSGSWTIQAPTARKTSNGWKAVAW